MTGRGIGSWILITLALVLSGAASAQDRATIGPVPPPGTDRGWRPARQDQRVLSDVPAYIWHHGCGPTALGMILGYWDIRGWGELVPGEAGLQTAAVDAMIADDSGSPYCNLPDGDHYQDYCCPRDDGGPTAPDRSETGGAHGSNCVADFMRTSWSAAGNRYGWSWSTDVLPAFEQYVQMVSSYGYTAQSWTFAQMSWSDYRAEIDAGRPVGLLVDTDGNGGTDHFIAAIGYNTATGEYACRDTWDTGVHWFDWSGMVSGNPWGIHSAYLFDFGSIEPGACCSLDQPCRLTPQGECGGESVFLGVGTSCTPDPCAGIIGACCAITGGCVVQFAFNCMGDHIYMGAGTVCDPDPCPAVGGACCAPDGSCTVTLPEDCPQSSTFHGMYLPCDPNPCRPNPHRGGSLLVHANPQLAYPDPAGYRGRSGLSHCSDAVTSVAGADPFVFFVIAAFDEGASPRLASTTFGIDYDPDMVGILEWGTCGDLDIPTSAWPAPGEGTLVVWQSPSTTALTEVYWFSGYSYMGAERDFRLVPHPTEGALFWDDQVPAHRDTIDCLGSLGFNTAGRLCCPVSSVVTDFSQARGRGLLTMNGPNPVAGLIRFRLATPEPHAASIALVDVAGKIVRRIETGRLPAGSHDLEMKTVDESGRMLPAGVYYLRSEAAGSVNVLRVVVVR